MFKRNGIIHKYFRRKEMNLYMLSDYIGTMSPANLNYIISNNDYLNPAKVEVCPNSIEPVSNSIETQLKLTIRLQHNIPIEATVFIYGGNLGKPQGIEFLLEVLEANRKRKEIYFVIVGDGTEYSLVKKWFGINKPPNALLLKGFPKNEYDELIQACDVGMIFLDKRFTIPNYPSRLLSYLENKMPVIIASDSCTDIGKIAQENGYGLWSLCGDLKGINHNISMLFDNPNIIQKMGEAGYRFLIDNYTVDTSYKLIMSHFEKPCGT
jgi:glycosyltransferase involved in cell wall biosynthesis